MPITPKMFIRILLKQGFELKSTNGSHRKFENPITKRTVIVPYHNRTLPLGLERQLYKDAGIKR
jgi:mRNA interferase HicA